MNVVNKTVNLQDPWKQTTCCSHILRLYDVSGFRGGVDEVQLGCVRWSLLTDVSGQPIGPISKVQSSTNRITAWTLKMALQIMAKRRLPSTNLRSVISQKSERPEPWLQSSCKRVITKQLTSRIFWIFKFMWRSLFLEGRTSLEEGEERSCIVMLPAVLRMRGHCIPKWKICLSIGKTILATTSPTCIHAKCNS